MSTPFSRDQNDPLALVPFTEQLLDSVTETARSSPRSRSIVRFHEHDEFLHRMLNAIEPQSYARPHRHANPAKPEAFVVLRGSVLVVRFSDDGSPVEGVLVSDDGSVKGVEVPPGAWHCLVSLQSGTVLFEVIQGPYDPATHKEFATWAPPEEDEAAGLAYIARLRAQFDAVIPELAARDQIEAEDEEIC